MPHCVRALLAVAHSQSKCSANIPLTLKSNQIKSNQIKSNQIKSNQIKSLLLSHHQSTSALVSEILMSVLQTVQKTKQKKTTIYIWTVHIYRLYRRQCAKYTYIYSVHIVYYKDILNYQLHIIGYTVCAHLHYVHYLYIM